MCLTGMEMAELYASTQTVVYILHLETKIAASPSDESEGSLRHVGAEIPQLRQLFCHG